MDEGKLVEWFLFQFLKIVRIRVKYRRCPQSVSDGVRMRCLARQVIHTGNKIVLFPVTPNKRSSVTVVTQGVRMVRLDVIVYHGMKVA